MNHKTLSDALLVALGVAFGMMFYPNPPTVHALPSITPTFTVDSSGESTAQDSFLTLREAILIANGSITGAFTDLEKAQLTNGCTFSGSTNNWTITGGCGLGFSNFINFTSTITQVNLTSALPDLTNAGTTIYGGGAVRINGSGMSSGDALAIAGDNMTVDGLAIVNVPPGASQYADIHVKSGKNAVLRNNYLGTVSGALNCTPTGVTRNSAYGVLVEPNSSGGSGVSNGVAFIYNNTVGCHTLSGVRVLGADYVYVGIEEDASTVFGNYIGTNSLQVNLGNSSNGIWLYANGSDGVRFNQVKGNYVYFNGGSGIALYGTSTNNTNSTYSNAIYANYVYTNTLDGIALTNAAYGNFIGNSSFPNGIVGNGQSGIRIDGSNNNAIASNTIGFKLGFSGSIVLPNAVGIVITDSASSNAINFNYIAGNSGDGFQLAGNANNNSAKANTIGMDYVGVIVPNGGSGVAIFGGAHDNLIGDAPFSTNQQIVGNSAYGVYIADSATTTNTVTNNLIGTDFGGTSFPNALDGVTIQAGANNNHVYTNTIAYNSGSGVYLTGAPANSINWNIIHHNRYYGIILDGSGTQLNVVNYDSIYNNGTAGAGFDGIGERNNASFNAWSQVSIFNNAGLGIDKNASSDLTNIVDGPFPIITSVGYSGGSVILHGTATPTALVELYTLATDPSGYGEGKFYIASTTANGGGNWSLTFGSPSVECYTGFQTYLASSEFGPNSCRTFLPLIMR